MKRQKLMNMDKAELMIIGVNSRLSGPALVEKFYIEEAGQPAFLDEIKACGLKDALMISTCDRSEVWFMAGPADKAHIHDKITSIFAQKAGQDFTDADIKNAFTSLQGIEALSYGLDVVCALESRVIGESQILGQFKQALDLATQKNMVSGLFQRHIQFILTTAKQVRHQTKLGEGTVSIANIARLMSQDLFGLDTKWRGLIIGLGEMAEIIAAALEGEAAPSAASAPPKIFDLTGPATRSASIAALRQRKSIDYAKLAQHIGDYDIVITAHGTGEYIIDKPMMEKALTGRREKPILLLDVAVPQDCAPEAASLDNLFYISLDELQARAGAGLDARTGAVKKARAIISQALADYGQVLDLAEAGFIDEITRLRLFFEAERDKLHSQFPSLSADEATRLLIKRLLHYPTIALKTVRKDDNQQSQNDSPPPSGQDLVTLLHRLFPDQKQ